MSLLVSDNGRVGFDDDLVGITVVDYCALLAPGVKLGVVSVMQRPCMNQPCYRREGRR